MFRFANEWVLWLLALLPLLVMLFVVSRLRRGARVRRFGEPAAVGRLMPYASRFRYVVKAVLVCLAYVFLIVGLARPQFGVQSEERQRSGSEIMLVLDVSRSMLAEDIKPNRLERAKLEISKLVNDLKQDRIGLILFAGKSFVQLPITRDYAAARMFLSEVSCDMISEQGTALGGALQLALNSFSPQEGTGKVIVVVSDGENHEDDPVSVAEEAKKQGVKIITVGIGSPSGTPIPSEGGGVKKDAEGNVVITRLDERVLTEVARATGGLYMRVGSQNASLRPVLDEIEKMEKGEYNEVVFSNYSEQYQLFLLISFIMLAFATFLLDRRNPWLNIDHLFGRMQKTRR